MSSRLRNLLLAFGISLTMWAGIIQGSISIYSQFHPDSAIVVAANG